VHPAVCAGYGRCTLLYVPGTVGGVHPGIVLPGMMGEVHPGIYALPMYPGRCTRAVHASLCTRWYLALDAGSVGDDTSAQSVEEARLCREE